MNTVPPTLNPEEVPAPAGHHAPAIPGGELLLHETLEPIEALESDWRRLTPASASPFQTYTWNLAWYHTHTGIQPRPLVFEWRRDGITTAILPCYREGKSIRLAGDRICDYQDAIAREPGEVTAMLRSAREWLDREGRGLHFRFERLSSEGLLYAALRDPAQAPSRSLHFEKSCAPCPFMDLQGGLDNYLATLSRKMRQDMNHALNRFEREAGEAVITILRDYEIRVDDLWNAAAFHTLHFRKGGESPFRDHRLLDLFARIAKDPDVGFQLSFLAKGADLLAVDFGFVRGRRYYGYLTAFDQAYARLAPGKVMLLKRIDRWVQEDGVDTLDFLAGDERYKRHFAGDRAYRVWSMRLMPDDLRNRIRRARLESDKRIRHMAKLALGKPEGLAR